ncbi:MAG: ATP-binding protein, partial [Sphingomonadaceae bacterium]|nr:ATP-binding protein [Sphingomonadaceae bacterium]
MADKNAVARTAKRKTNGDEMEDLEAVNLAADWADISQGLRKDLGHQLHSQWIKPIQVGGLCRESGRLDLYLPTEFSANWVQDRFADRLSLAWKIARSEVRTVNIQVHPGRRKLPDINLSDGRRAANDGGDSSMIAIGAANMGDAGFISSVGLDPSLTFASFVTGETNILGCNAAQRMAATEQPQFSPLYLKAATGQGKTHLLHAIGHAYLGAHPRARIFYCSAERFMVEFVQALKANQMIEFKARLRSFDLLLVDDIQ